MPKQPTSVKAYLDTLPADRRTFVEAVLKVVRKNADKKFEEGIQYGMPSFYLPHSVYPSGYHCDAKQPLPFVGVSSRAAGVSLYLFGVYCDPAEQKRLQTEWKATGMRLDMGKSCIRVKKLEQMPLDVLGASVRRMTAAKFVKSYEANVPGAGAKPAKKAAKKSTKKSAKKSTKKAAKKTAKKSAKTATRKAAKKPAKKTARKRAN